MGAYPKRIRLFEEFQEGKNDYKILHLQSLSATRWTTRVKAVDVIFEKATELRKTLETLKDDPLIPSDVKQNPWNSSASTFRTTCTSIWIWHENFVLLEKFSNELQSADISAEYTLYSLQHILQRLQELRNDVEF